jgi:hypothetical protein
MDIACFGLLVFFSCSLPERPAPADSYCQIARPIHWSPADTRKTKEQVDVNNRDWKRICGSR